MKRICTLLLIVGLCAFNSLKAQNVEEITIKQLLSRVNENTDTLYVVNFWATWCPPCVEELPIFAAPELNDSDRNVKVLLVSLDFKSQKEKQLLPFLEKKKIQQEVILLDERNPNDWIEQIEESWSGAIPATVVYHQNKKVFHEGEMTLPQLHELIRSINQ
ncbi:TlpA family protein disulfide reductase [Carboxylicivirga marina]|uniref:TlpA family protein disulfide reductase n=1 Tax=Carboxylicivirga marina TaxID=2800988 RepID=A0ABS1HKK9_9BACT|nr:TlpA disulfide reductase family protein [Carboxylicivirga marina]MBK3518092.1 TlpA family protein disulfide reductase [Carboxylicivirga marina]